MGDCAYPILTQIQKPFTARTIRGVDQNVYDEIMKKWQVRIKKAFRILKNKWSTVKNMNVRGQHAPLIIVACCVI